MEERPIIDHACSFRNGNLLFSADPEHLPDIIDQMDPIFTLISYIAYFPNKDFSKIKLKTGSNQFAIHFLDKRYLDRNFLGVLSVSELDATSTFESWGVEDLMAEFVFENYQEMWQNGKNPDFHFSEFEQWLEPEIADFFEDWQDAKAKTLQTKRPSPLSPMKPTAHHEKSFEQWWDLQIINEYGQPITDLISFIDDQAFTLDSESDRMEQNLESMSISALKLLIDTQGGWNIKYLKNRLRNEMGYQYTFFEKFTVEDIRYLIVLNSSLYDLKSEKCLQAFRGFEFDLLEEIASRVSTHTIFFSQQGQLNPENKQLTQRIIMNSIDHFYSTRP
jgi:hypothetical protein